MQNFAAGRAWDRSNAANRVTFGGWIVLLIAAPFALTLGALYDGATNAEQRIPTNRTRRVIQLALTTPPNLDLSNPRISTQTAIDYAATTRWRDRFTPRYVQSIADYTPASFKDVYVDVVFDTGFIWRCESLHAGTSLAQCQDLREKYGELMRQFFRDGQARCENCEVRIEPAAQTWQNQVKPGEPRQITLAHHAGRVVIARETIATGIVECKLIGANPVIVRECKSSD